MGHICESRYSFLVLYYFLDGHVCVSFVIFCDSLIFVGLNKTARIIFRRPRQLTGAFWVGRAKLVLSNHFDKI
jgi:hypothetical protein